MLKQQTILINRPHLLQELGKQGVEEMCYYAPPGGHPLKCEGT